jgi:hypothetical protein
MLSHFLFHFFEFGSSSFISLTFISFTFFHFIEAVLFVFRFTLNSGNSVKNLPFPFDRQCNFQSLHSLSISSASINFRNRWSRFSEHYPDVTVYHISQFLCVLKYQFPCETEEWNVRLSSSDKKLIYSVFDYLLQDFPVMKKCSYKVTIPEEIRADPTFSEMATQNRELWNHDLFEEMNVDAFESQLSKRKNFFVCRANYGKKLIKKCDWKVE